MNKESVSSPSEATKPVTSVTMTTTTSGVTSKATATTTVTTSSDQLEVCTAQQPLKQQTQLTIATVTLPNSGSVSISPNPSPTTTPTTPSTTPSPTIKTVSPSPATQQQFTVHGQFINHNHSGPAPNVTVNPHYQPEAPPTSPVLRPNVNAPNDQQIRVLTPSEIMRTLPSLCQDTYDIPVSQITVRIYLVQVKIYHLRRALFRSMFLFFC